MSYAVLTAVASTSIQAMPTHGVVTLSGVVERVVNCNEFMLRDGSGTTAIKLPPEKDIVLNEGDSVSVTGMVIPDSRQKDVRAYRIKIVQRADV